MDWRSYSGDVSDAANGVHTYGPRNKDAGVSTHRAAKHCIGDAVDPEIFLVASTNPAVF